MTHFVLVHSPFLGPSIWEPLNSVLIERGERVTIPDLRAEVDDVAAPYEALARAVSALCSPETRIVLHSGAGALAPLIWRADPRLRGMDFLDALMPHPCSSWLDTLPAGMRKSLLAAVVHDRLPPWPDWLPPGTLEQLIPEDRKRRAISEEAPRVPLSFVSRPCPAAPGWAPTNESRYIRLSQAYAGQAEKAAAIGLRVTVFPGNHLGMVSAAERVADLLIGAADAD